MSAKLSKLLSVLLVTVVFGTAPLYAQTQVVGQVEDGGTDEVLPGASIVVKGTTIGATTGVDGRYQIEVPDIENDTLVFSYVGYEPQEVPVEGQTEIDVILAPETVEGEEVVVVGYGEQKKASVVGAIESIDAEAIEQSPTANVNVAMAGRLPGLTALQGSGEPGREQFNLFIRGRSTTNAQNPLILVDGVERPDYASLDPNEIASISILKDASATAVYGVRGANGVILITTKRGKAGQRSISFTAEGALKNFTRFPEVVNSAEYAILRNEALANIGEEPAYTQEEIELYRSGKQPMLYPNRNYVEEFTKDYSSQQNYNLTVRGGGDIARYFVNAGFIQQGGHFQAAEGDSRSPWDESVRLRRYNFRSNIDLDLNESLSAVLNLAGNLGKQRNPAVLDQPGVTANESSTLLLGQILSLPPNAYAENLTPAGGVIHSPEAAISRPIYGALNRSGYNVSDRNRLNATFGLEQEMDFLTNGLSAEVRFSFDTRNINTQTRRRTYSRYRPVIGTAQDGSDSLYYQKYGEEEDEALNNELTSTSRKTSNLDVSLNYGNTFGSHDVTGKLLYNQYRRTINAELPYNYVGLVGRATYGYDDRYLAEVNFGYNGSEQFAPGNRFGFFPSLALGWVPTQESFLDDSDVLSYLKLRGSYGIVGNDQLGASRFLYLSEYSQGDYAYGGLSGTITEIQLANRNVSWERAHKYNLGLESEFFGKLGLNVDVFYERRDNILARPNSVPTGFLGTGAIPPLNFAEVNNRGVEGELTFNHTFNPDFFFQMRAHGSFARNEIQEFDEPLLPENYAYRNRQEGFRLGQRFGYDVLGFFTSEEEIENYAEYNLGGGQPNVGDFKYKDANNDGVIDEADVVPIGHPDVPEIQFGASFNMQFHQFDLSFLLQGVGNHSQYLQGERFFPTGNFQYAERHLKRFTPERYEAGEEILYPRLTFTENANYRINSFWVRNASFLRLKNAEIGYTIPSDITGRFGAKSVRIYANGLNLLTWDRLPTDDFDPELADGQGLVYPLLRTYNFGVRFTF